MQSWDHEELYLLGGIFVFQDAPEIMKCLTDNSFPRFPGQREGAKEFALDLG